MNLYNFKHFISACLLVALPFLFTACDEKAWQGQGDIVSRTRPVGQFDAISVGGDFDVFLTQGPAADILLEGQENVLTEVATQVTNNKLEIKYDRKRIRVAKTPKIYITIPHLNYLSLSGSNSVKGLTKWQVSDLTIKSSGSGHLNLTVMGAKKLECNISGSADINLNGDAHHQEVDISGSGNLKAFGLATKTADINISGSGKCEVAVAEQLKTRISGSGKVRYKGNPTVNTSISGSGSVTRAD
jgi:hypothetical protein